MYQMNDRFKNIKEIQYDTFISWKATLHSKGSYDQVMQVQTFKSIIKEIHRVWWVRPIS